MSYIDQSDYKGLLNKFAQGTQKQKLQENYVDLRPINTFEGAITSLAPAYKEYDGMRSMEEAEQELSPKQRKIAAAAPPEDEITGADFAAMKKDKKDEGLYGDGPMLAPTGYQLENLSIEERKELKDYVQAVQTTKKAIKELLEKAKAPKMEGGDMTGGSISLSTSVE